MLSSLRMRLGLVQVTTTPKNIVVEGIPTNALLKDIYRVWGSSVFYKYMFTGIRVGELKLRHFFGLDFLYMLQTIYDDRMSVTPKRTLRKIIDELKTKTWLGSVERDPVSITDMSVVDQVAPFPLKPYQREFVELFGKIVPAYKLRGYMLDAAAGSGKTVMDLVLGEALHADHVVILTPKNAINRVWEDTIKDVILTKRSYWISTGVEQPTLDHHYYICHYESLEYLVNFFRTQGKNLKNVFVVLDESHNFNRVASDRTQLMIELCNMPSVSYNIWASGTPIMAWGTECIPFLRCIDPMFDDDCEMRFRKIYGASAKRGLDILRHRIGHVKYHVAKQEAIKTVVHTEQVMVKMPGSERFTLSAIREQMRKFIEGRQKYYADNKKLYESQYNLGLEYFEMSIRGPEQQREFNVYKTNIKMISGGFDPKTMAAEAQFCNRYEQKTILPNIPQNLRAEFKSAKSVVKYVQLKILGEALGTVLGRARSECHVEMVKYLDLPGLVDGATKKSLIFTSYTEVVDAVAARMTSEGYFPVKVYGATNKDLAGIVKKFFTDPDVNPLVATFQSLSTAVPLIAANRIIMTNQPWRAGVREQTIARAARLGQDEDVWVFDCLLDTGNEPNISTRSSDIMAWSAEMTASILGITNVDLDTLTLESASVNDGWMQEFIPEDVMTTPLEISFESGMAQSFESEEPVDLPRYLYHGSAYKQDELMPGFQRSGTLVNWDNTEDNTWLYATNDRDEAIMLGISSAIEKKYKLDRYSYDSKTRTLEIEVSEDLTRRDIENLSVYLYTLKSDPADGWMANYNPSNGIVGEYKTQRTVEDIARTEPVNVVNALRNLSVRIKKNT